MRPTQTNDSAVFSAETSSQLAMNTSSISSDYANLLERVNKLEKENEKLRNEKTHENSFYANGNERHYFLEEKLDKLAIDWNKFRDKDRVKVFHELERLIRLENHAKITIFHLNSNTSQKSLNLFNFPRPFFKDDSTFVERHFDIIRECQKKLLVLFETTWEEKANEIVNRIVNYKQQ